MNSGFDAQHGGRGAEVVRRVPDALDEALRGALEFRGVIVPSSRLDASLPVLLVDVGDLVDIKSLVFEPILSVFDLEDVPSLLFISLKLIASILICAIVDTELVDHIDPVPDFRGSAQAVRVQDIVLLELPELVLGVIVVEVDLDSVLACERIRGLDCLA